VVATLGVLLEAAFFVLRSAPPAPPPVPPAPVPPALTLAAPKRGVGTWHFAGVDRALADAALPWYYTWKVDPDGVAAPASSQFVPMIWGPASATPEALAEAARQGPTLLGFNEPDVAEQANMSVRQALELWPRLLASGQRLGSPAPAQDAATPGGWLDTFMTGATARGYRVDFIALHWYGATNNPATAVAQLRRYLQAAHDRYHLPIWLTEYALIDFSPGVQTPRHPAPAQQAAFITASTTMLDALPYLERYAWFALNDTGTQYRTGLYTEAGAATSLGVAYRALRP
jgi:hypothetical protein